MKSVKISPSNPRFSSRSVSRELSLLIKELFQGLGISKIKVESRLEMSVQNFTSDLIKCFDEVTDPSDFVKLWHVGLTPGGSIQHDREKGN